MSDTPQGEGWWQASDGKYYSPEQRPGYSAPQPQPVATAPTQQWNQAQPQAQWGYAAAPQPQVVKGKRSWGCLGTGLAVVGALVVLTVVIVIIAAIAGSGSDSTPDEEATSEEETSEEVLFPGRADAQEEDQERPIGGTAEIDSFQATVTGVEFVQSLDEFFTDGYYVATVTVTNKDSESHPYSAFDWRFQSENGEVVDAGLGYGHTLDTGALVPGGTATGTVIFDAKTPTGFLIWKPDPFDAARGIWPVG